MAGFNENVLILFAKYKEFHLDERSFICGKRSCFFLLSLLLTAFPQTEVSAQETKILPGNLEMARRMVPQGAVLLRNESDVLPLPHGERVAVFGSGQLAFQPGGGGASLFAASIPRFSSTGCRIQPFYRNTSVTSLQLFPFPPTSDQAHSWKRKVAGITTGDNIQKLPAVPVCSRTISASRREKKLRAYRIVIRQSQIIERSLKCLLKIYHTQAENASITLYLL